MPLLERIDADIRNAVRARDRGRAQTLRTIRSAVQYAALDGRTEADDELVRTVLAREARRREEAIAIYRDSGRDDKVDAETAELELIRAYLPPAVGPDDIESEAAAVIAEVGAQGPSDIGKVMGPLMARLRGRGTVDGRAVSGTVRRMLTGDVE